MKKRDNLEPGVKEVAWNASSETCVESTSFRLSLTILQLYKQSQKINRQIIFPIINLSGKIKLSYHIQSTIKFTESTTAHMSAA